MLFDGPDAPGPLEAAQRLAEGAVVAVEASLAARWEDRELAGAVASFENAAGLAAAVEGAPGQTARQERFLDERGSLEDACGRFLDACEALAAKAGRRPVRAMEAPVREFLLYGWVGERDFGDDLLLLMAVERIGRRWPES